MSHIVLRCPSCDASHAPGMERLECGDCGAPLEVGYLDRGASAPASTERATLKVPSPLHDQASALTLGEGNTPCIKLDSVGRKLGIERLYAKLEFLNPTGSFKDRGTAVMMSAAREHGVAEVVEDSSGNAGASVSAYAARAGIKAHVFAPASAPPAKLQQIRVYGAQAHLIEGSREKTTAAAVEYARRHSLVYASHALSPYFLEGTKTFAYEVAAQLAGRLPEHIVFPVGNGSLYIGTFRGFEELREAGAIARLPRLHCVQSDAVKPVASAFAGREWGPGDARPTVAGGIAVAAPPRLDRMVSILQATEAEATTVSEGQIKRWQRLLAEEEGIFAEPTSAAAFVGVENLAAQGAFGANETVLVPVTGFGLKDRPPE